MMSLSILNDEFFIRNPPLICVRVVGVVTGKGNVAALEVKNGSWDIHTGSKGSTCIYPK